MLPNKNEYAEMVKKASPPSAKLKDFTCAFVVGGLICVIGQLLAELYDMLGISETVVKMLVPCSLIFLSALFTGLKVYDKLARHAGAGTLVPITGFSNAIASPAIEFKAEGQVLGLGVKMFSIAGPVIVYGTVASVLYGAIYYLVTKVF